MRAEGGEVAASIFPRVGSAEQSIDSSPARLFILIAADGRHAAAVLPILSTSLHHFVAKSKKRKRNGSFPQVQFPRAALSDQSFSRSIIPLSAFNKQG